MKNLMNISPPLVTFHNPEHFFDVSQHIEIVEDSVCLIHLKLRAEAGKKPPVCRLEWSVPAIDIHSMWHPGTDRNKAFQIDWGEGFASRGTTLAPVATLFNVEGKNRLTFAFTDALNHLTIKAGIHEEDSTFHCSITLFEEPTLMKDEYNATLRIDRRDVPYYEALEEVVQWWSRQPGMTPSPPPVDATNPAYSTWYSYHQDITADQLEEQARLAKELGCDTIIVDDGWQTDDNGRGYAYTGDWEVCPGKFPDMGAHIAAIQSLGMKYMLWYSVPFVGKRSKVWGQFADKLLSTDDNLNAGILDPRFPEVREYLISVYEQAVTNWNIDGLKLDFVDSFRLPAESPGVISQENGRDYVSVPEAVDRLLSDVMDRLKAIKPNILIEFRQTYIGPLMRKYGNMFRANDCPNDFLQNRVRTLDLRLLSGDTVVHSDMIMFNPRDKVENAAMQMIHVMFAVPQISVRLDRVGDRHLAMLRFWISFIRDHRDVLLYGKLQPFHPELLYPKVTASNRDKTVIAIYSETVVELDHPTDRLIIVNGTPGDRLYLRFSCSFQGNYEMKIKDCYGQTVHSQSVELNEGLQELIVPSAGFVDFMLNSPHI
ncbi:glycoside hydrolase family 36 protein [Paenibacillus sp. VMFN-D1]|uniref:glycoside hydrolase family 36 protein n=1 Tax=Paenibacillus sp. VMFN-D1 TaxID=2135608 RepID=UPI000E232F1A|nr:glycoside hydrolase family 36 protein [Paenibacillus sp. VMFN-D1]RED37410.1 alpha-galactosidase [Paenibacillus sp. VMFN-D1]